jgi:transposase
LKGWARDTALELFLKVSPAELHENALYEAMDALLGHWAGIEKGLYRRREKPPELLLYDLTSSYFEGHKVKRGRYGYSRDHRSDRLQILIALVKDEHGVPLSVQLLKGNRADVGTVVERMISLKRRFGIAQGMYVGDNGTVSAMNLEFLREHGFDYLVCLERRAIQPLLERADQAVQLGLFDERGWISFDHEEKRYVLCHSGQRAERDRRRREARMAKGQAQLERLQARVAAGRLNQEKKIIERATRILSSTQSSVYFRYEVRAGVFVFHEATEKIQAEEAVDGKYLLECTRTNLDPERIRENYQDLKLLEGAFRVIKSFLEFRPVFHWKDRRVQAHLYLVFLAYWLERQIEIEWQQKGFKQRVCEVLRDLNGVRLEQVQIDPLPMPIYRISNWQERQEVTELLGLTELIYRAVPVGKPLP